MSTENPTRPRRTTLECFNEELAVLDRPLENDVEYYDDPPPPSPWGWAGGIAGAAVLVGVVTGFLLTKQPSVALASTQGSVPTKLEEPAPNTAAKTAAAIEPSTPSAVDVETTNQPSARTAPASKAAWAKVVGRKIRRR